MGRATKILLLFTAAAVLLNGTRILGEWALGWNANLSSALLYLTPLLLLPASCACAIAVLSALVGLFSRFRHEALITMLCCVTFVIVYYLSNYCSILVRRSIYIRAAVRGTLITKAIQQFEEQNGIAPESLDQLVPKYLTQIPPTGIAADPNFQYHRFGSGEREPRWELSLHPSPDAPNADGLIYWPEGNYPKKLPEGQIETLGRWVYIHDAF